MIRHIVMFKLKDIKDEKEKNQLIETLVASFSKLKTTIDSVSEYDVYRNQGQNPSAYDVIINSTFESWGNLKAYSAHPNHQACIKENKIIAKEKTVIDYEFQN